MSPLELFHEARLSEAVREQSRIVAARPVDVAERLLLCDMLAFVDDREALARHLAQVARVSRDLQSYAAEYRKLLDADKVRHAGGQPQFFLETPSHVRRRLQAARCLSEDHDEEAIDLLDSADESAPWVEGFVDGRPFEGWRDSDDLLGPVLEAFQGDRYFWISVEQVRKLRLEDMDSLRDSLYRPATVWLTDGSERELFIPVLYTGTANHPEEGIRTGAGIDWVEHAGLIRGFGSRTFLFGEEELTLSDFRQVETRPA